MAVFGIFEGVDWPEVRFSLHTGYFLTLFSSFPEIFPYPILIRGVFCK